MIILAIFYNKFRVGDNYIDFEYGLFTWGKYDYRYLEDDETIYSIICDYCRSIDKDSIIDETKFLNGDIDKYRNIIYAKNFSIKDLYGIYYNNQQYNYIPLNNLYMACKICKENMPYYRKIN